VCFAVDPDPSVVPVSLRVSMVVEGSDSRNFGIAANALKSIAAKTLAWYSLNTMDVTFCTIDVPNRAFAFGVW
jgi:hypothetical protein